MFNTRYLCGVCDKPSQTAPGRTLHALVRHKVWMTGSTLDRAWFVEWGDLAQYNADRSRGRAFAPEYVTEMAEKQARYDREVLGYDSGGQMPVTLQPGESTTLTFELQRSAPSDGDAE